MPGTSDRLIPDSRGFLVSWCILLVLLPLGRDLLDRIPARRADEDEGQDDVRR